MASADGLKTALEEEERRGRAASEGASRAEEDRSRAERAAAEVRQELERVSQEADRAKESLASAERAYEEAAASRVSFPSCASCLGHHLRLLPLGNLLETLCTTQRALYFVGAWLTRSCGRRALLSIRESRRRYGSTVVPAVPGEHSIQPITREGGWAISIREDRGEEALVTAGTGGGQPTASPGPPGLSRRRSRRRERAPGPRRSRSKLPGECVPRYHGRWNLT